MLSKLRGHHRRFSTTLVRDTAVKVATTAVSSTIPLVKNFINGVFEDSKTQHWIDVINPATQEVVCKVPQSTPEELARAEQGAIEASKTWRETPVQQRQVIDMLSFAISESSCSFTIFAESFLQFTSVDKGTY